MEMNEEIFEALMEYLDHRIDERIDYAFGRDNYWLPTKVIDLREDLRHKLGLPSEYLDK